MSKKEKLQQPESQEDSTPEAGVEPEIVPETETPQDAGPAFEELKKQLADVQSQAADYKDGWQRSVAEFQNYRRRVETEKAETYQTAVGNIIKRYLPILDDMERALAKRPDDLPWAEGIELIYRKLQSILEAEGLKRIEAEGQMFDPTFHEAILQEPSNCHESGQIISVIQNGYMLGERVIRPAIVKVAQ
jgi:molecular chaperone GrpE